MNVDQSTLAARLRRAREQAGITQEQAATTIKLPRTALVQIESGNRAVSSLELASLARCYRHDPADFFAEDMPEADADPALVLFRLPDVIGSNPQVKEEVERCIEVCRDGAELEEILSLPKRTGPPAYNVPAPKTVMDAVLQGQSVAEQERLRLGLGDRPIRNIADLLNDIGVWASGVRLPNDSISGLFLADPRFGLVILVNFDHPRARRRFSYAHEFAHALLDRELVADVSDAQRSGDLREKRANAFAAAFLMPEGGVKAFIRDLNKGQPSRMETPVFDVAADQWAEASLRPPPGSQTLSYQDVALLAAHFHASYPAAVYRLKSLDLVSASECDALLKQDADASGFMRFLNLFDPNEKATGKPDRELVAQVAHLAMEAYRRDEISRGRLLEIARVLRLDGKELLRFAQASRRE